MSKKKIVSDEKLKEMEEDFCVGKLLKECEEEKKAILGKPFSLANFWDYLIAGADTSETRKYLLKGINELQIRFQLIKKEEGRAFECFFIKELLGTIDESTRTLGKKK